MRSNRHADVLARVLNSTGQFKGKARLVDSLGRLSSSWNRGRGAFPLADGKTATVDLGDRIQRLMWGGAYEPNIKRCLSALLRPGDTFVDVGAHIGFFSLIAASLVGPAGKVYAFEADGDLFRKLQLNASEYSWIIPSWHAVWKNSGPVLFSNPRRNGESGWGKLTAVRDEGNVVPVDSISLDDWHESLGFPAIRAIKIDAEGSEPFILEGSRRLFTKTRPFVIVELNDQLLEEVGHSTKGLIAVLRENRYRIFEIGLDTLDELSDSSPVRSSEVLCLPSDGFEEENKAALWRFTMNCRQ
jgi:FkbM family methyltransferase